MSRTWCKEGYCGTYTHGPQHTRKIKTRCKKVLLTVHGGNGSDSARRAECATTNAVLSSSTSHFGIKMTQSGIVTDQGIAVTKVSIAGTGRLTHQHAVHFHRVDIVSRSGLREMHVAVADAHFLGVIQFVRAFPLVKIVKTVFGAHRARSVKMQTFPVTFVLNCSLRDLFSNIALHFTKKRHSLLFLFYHWFSFFRSSQFQRLLVCRVKLLKWEQKMRHL